MKSSKRLIFIFYFILLILPTLIFGQSATQISDKQIPKGLELIAANIDYLVRSFYNSSLPILNITAEVLFLILIFLIVATLTYTAIDQMDFLSDSFLIKSILSISVAGLAYIALPEQFIELLIPSYKSMASSIFAILPFAAIVTYATTQVRNQFIARVLWFAVTMTTILLFFTQGIPAFQSGQSGMGLFYTGLMLVGLIGSIWIKAIRNWFFKGELQELTQDRMRGIEIDSAFRKANQSEAENLSRLVRKAKK
jgi:hypothetical protein